MIRISRFIAVMAVFTFVLVGCTSITEQKLVGAWEMEEGGYPMLTFNDDGTFWEAVDEGEESTGTWRVQENTLYMTNDIDGAMQIEQRIDKITENRLSLIILDQFQIVYKKRETE